MRQKEVAHLVLVSPPVYLAPSELGDRRVRAQVGAYLKVYEFMRNNKDFTIAASGQLVKLFALGKTLDLTERNWNAVLAEPAALHRVADHGERHRLRGGADRRGLRRRSTSSWLPAR